MSSVDQNAPMTPHSQGDVGGFAWADSGVGYSLVGHGGSGILEADCERGSEAGARDLSAAIAPTLMEAGQQIC